MSNRRHHDSDCDDDDSSDEVILPRDVQDELKRRREAITAGNPITDPVAPDILPKVRKFFLEDDGNPFTSGGFLDICERLGMTAQSDDPLVKDTKYNIWYLGATRTGQDTHQWWRKREEDHEGRVRLLRYQEFIQRQESKGLGAPAHWAFDGEGPQLACLVQEKEEEEEEVEKERKADPDERKSSMRNEFDLESDVILQLASVFTLGFYNYVNHDKIYMGLAAGTESAPVQIPGSRNGVRAMKIEASLVSFIEQSQEVRDRYRHLQCPLGPPYTLGENTPIKKAGNNKKNKGKNNKKSGGNNNNINNNSTGVTHTSEINTKTTMLLQAMLEHKNPSLATGKLFFVMAEMLSAGVTADVDLARALLSNGELLLKLRKVALDHAVDAETAVDCLNRPKITAEVWWKTEEEITALVGKTVFMLVLGPTMRALSEDVVPAGDGERAIQFYKDSFEPALLLSLLSKHSTEQIHALTNLSKSMLTLPVPIAFALIKDKKKWALLETLCETKPVVPVDHHHLNPRQAEREALDAPCVPAQVAQLFQNICCRGLKVDSAKNISEPQKLVSKLTERGCVPLLISMANSSHDNVSVAALCALGDISRNKECRLLILQDPRGVSMIRDLLSNCSNGSKMSPAMLLIVHLLWDDEWRQILVELDDPPIETVMVRWAVFAMKEILHKACQVRKSSQKYLPMLQELRINKFRAPQGSLEAEQAELKLQELQAKQENVPNWCDLERETHSHLEMNCLLRRALMCLCHLVKIGNERFQRAGVLHLVACLIDVPYHDVYTGAIIMIQNYCVNNDTEIEPNEFPDPDHLLRSIILRMERLADDGEMNQTASILMGIAARMSNDHTWQPYFDRIAAQEVEHRILIDHTIRRISHSFGNMTDVDRDDQPSTRRGPGTSGPTATLGGRLAKCDACGKIEGKVGQLKSCGRCASTRYCNRDCQLKHWKIHKKQCAKLVLAASVKK